MTKPSPQLKQKKKLKREKHNNHLRTLQKEQKASFNKNPEAFRERRQKKQDKLLQSNVVEEGLKKNSESLIAEPLEIQ